MLNSVVSSPSLTCYTPLTTAPPSSQTGLRMKENIMSDKDNFDDVDDIFNDNKSPASE